jgi:hypothetical protein
MSCGIWPQKKDWGTLSKESRYDMIQLFEPLTEIESQGRLGFDALEYQDVITKFGHIAFKLALPRLPLHHFTIPSTFSSMSSHLSTSPTTSQSFSQGSSCAIL